MSYMSIWGNTSTCSNDKEGQPLWCRSPGTNPSRWKTASTAAKIPQAHTNNHTMPQGNSALTSKHREALLWTEGMTSWASCLAYRTETCLAMQRHLSHRSLPCLSRLIIVHALGEQMTDDLQLKNRSTVSWPLNADLSPRGEMYLKFLPCRRH